MCILCFLIQTYCCASLSLGERGIEALFVEDELLRSCLALSHASSVVIATGFPTHHMHRYQSTFSEELPNFHRALVWLWVQLDCLSFFVGAAIRWWFIRGPECWRFSCHRFLFCSPPEETDGPPGAVAIAAMLLSLGKEVTMVADRRAVTLTMDIIDDCVKSGKKCTWGRV